METSLGNIEVELFDTVTPRTVENFMNYVNDGDFTNSFIHRSVPGFIIQGGGFTFENGELAAVPTDLPVTNEFGRSNIRGTIAMAKVSGNPNSATSHWFFNLADNSANLDTQNGGFTVFGQVIGSGMEVVDAIAALTVWNAGGAFTNLPLIGYSGSGNIQQDNLVMIYRIISVSVSRPMPWLPLLLE
jgi:cyclophilin family peptidyl-prolyl cis-trans isomerase